MSLIESKETALKPATDCFMTLLHSVPAVARSFPLIILCRPLPVTGAKCVHRYVPEMWDVWPDHVLQNLQAPR